jgi:hypothetical protein
VYGAARAERARRGDALCALGGYAPGAGAGSRAGARAHLEVDLALALLIEEPGADLWPLGVEQDGDVLVCGRGS